MTLQLISLPVFGLRIYFYIYFSVGDTRRCDIAFFPGNDYLDKLEREVEIYFIVEDSQFSEFIEFERDSAWLFVADDDSKDVNIFFL